MGDVILFPGGNERLRRDIENILESQLEISDPRLCECVKKRVLAVLEKNPGIPSLNLRIDLPAGLTEESIQPVIDTFQNEYTNKISEYSFGLIVQICILEARLCKFELGICS